MNEDAPALLIVDDHPPNLRLYQAILKDLGADLHLAASGEQALAQCAQREFAMVLLDVHLAGMSGFDVALRLRESDPPVDTPIVFVSAVRTHEGDAFRGYRLGAVDYLVSPVVPDILRAKASVFIRLFRLHHEAQAQRLAIESAYRELRSAHSELEHFSYSVSHDLRTPLSQITMFVELLRMHCGDALDERAQRHLSLIGESSRNMDGLIKDLLALASMSRGELSFAPVDLSALVREVAAEVSREQPQRSVQWVLADGVKALGDPGMLRAALSNLIGNAWKYSAGREAPRIEFGSFDDEGQTIFFIGDNGAGFDVEAAGDRLFRPFQRFHLRSAFEGTGIGLATVQRVVVRHGGSIWADSAPGMGARFFFTLRGSEHPIGRHVGSAA